MTSQKIAIIGAGIAGLTVAHRLQNLPNVQITLFEKARGVSGRTSTRRAEPHHFDHGAPFFIAKSDKFQTFINPMLAAGVLSDWQAKVAEVSGTQVTEQYQWQANRYFVAQPKMNEMAKFIAKQLTNNVEIKLGTRVGKIEKVDLDVENLEHSQDTNAETQHSTQDNSQQWQLTSDTGAKVNKSIDTPLALGEQGDLGNFDWVICTAPPEQAVELIPSSLPFYPRIEQSKTDGCYALMLGFDTPLDIDFDVALIKDSALSRIVVNSQKPMRPDAYSLTILSSNQWAEQHIDADQEWVKSELLKATRDVLKIEPEKLQKATHMGMHRWRYANTSPELEQYNQNQSAYLLDTEAQLGVAGDWLIKGSVENAFRSGDELANSLIKILADSQ